MFSCCVYPHLTGKCFKIILYFINDEAFVQFRRRPYCVCHGKSQKIASSVRADIYMYFTVFVGVCQEIGDFPLI